MTMNKLNIKDKQLKHLSEIIDMMCMENEAQVAKWGIQDRHIFEWAMFAAEEFGEFIKEINEYGYDRTSNPKEIIKEGIQTMTLIAKILEGLF